MKPEVKKDKREKEHTPNHILLKSNRILMRRKKKNMEDSLKGYRIIESIRNNLDEKILSFLSEKSL